VRQVSDETVARGYRELRSKSAMKRLLILKVKIQHGLCFYCHKEFETFEDVTPDHREPKGMGGGRRDDHPDNIVAACWPCNSDKGSRRN
jgi:5-methylcytosine-specific restriction endonuclease McrA